MSCNCAAQGSAAREKSSKILGPAEPRPLATWPLLGLGGGLCEEVTSGRGWVGWFCTGTQPGPASDAIIDATAILRAVRKNIGGFLDSARAATPAPAVPHSDISMRTGSAPRI